MRNLYRHLVSRLHLGDILWRLEKKGLYCFNFHRIGNWKSSEFDPCVFSCTAKSFRDYLKFFKSEFRVVSLPEVEALIASGQTITERLALITFDDGYRDNYSLALPILVKEGVNATFFITTSLIGHAGVSWWDEFAWHVRRRVGKTIEIKAWGHPYFVNGIDLRQDIRNVLGLVKGASDLVERQLVELREKYGEIEMETTAERLFMNWQEVCSLVSKGMHIGAHSHSHEQFSNLTARELKYELETSRSILERKLDIEIGSLSYPVGKHSSFDSTMFEQISDCGYELAFSFSSTVNLDLLANRFQLGRISIDSEFDASTLKERCVVAKRA